MNKLAQEIKRIGYNTVLPLVAPKEGQVQTERLDSLGTVSERKKGLQAQPYIIHLETEIQDYKVLTGQDVIEAAKQAGLQQIWVIVANEEAEKVEAEKANAVEDSPVLVETSEILTTIKTIEIDGSKTEVVDTHGCYSIPTQEEAEKEANETVVATLEGATVTIHWSESSFINQHVKEGETLSYPSAEKMLAQATLLVNQDGGYDKTKYTLTLTDGSTYTGRVDLGIETEGQSTPIANTIASVMQFHLNAKDDFNKVSDPKERADMEEWLAIVTTGVYSTPTKEVRILGYRDLQKVLKKARNEGANVQVRLNATKKSLQDEVARLNLV